MRTCDNHRIKGWFYFPETPNDRVPGILTWTQDSGANLELIGGLSPRDALAQIGTTPLSTVPVVYDTFPSTIYGESDTGKRISLWNVERGNSKTRGDGTVQEEFWYTSWACMGAHVISADSPVLMGFRIALDDLYYLTSDGRFCAPQWTSIEGVDHPGEKQDDGTLLLPYTLPVVGGFRAGCADGSLGDTTYRIDTVATRPWISPATEAFPKLKLEFMMKRHRSGPSIEVSASASASIKLVNDSPGSAEGLLHVAKPLLGLMSLATFDTSGVEQMTGQTVDGHDVALLCRTGHHSEPDQVTEPTGVVFTLDDVPLDGFLATWQRLSSGGAQAQYALNVAVGIIGHSPLLVEEHVSQVLAAAEGFDRWCLRGGKNSKLETRLTRLHGHLSEELKTRLQLDAGRWSDWAVWARNHVAHGGAEEHRDLGNYYQLKTIADTVRLVLYLVALKEFGVPDAQVALALNNHPRLRVLADRCAEMSGLPGSPER